jgi:hypothetical protein
MAGLEDDRDGRRKDGGMRQKNLKCKQFLGRNTKISYT